MKIFTLSEVEDKHIGKRGTPEREEYERRVTEEISAYHARETIKQARLEKRQNNKQKE